MSAHTSHTMLMSNDACDLRALLVLVIVSCLCAFSVLHASPVRTDVKCGIDNLIDTRFELVRGKRVVLVTHAAARAKSGRSTLDEFRRANINVLRVLTPEHGFYGVTVAGTHVSNDTLDGTPALSLYGTSRRPAPSMISDADVVVIDLQDIGTRSYTFLSTMIEVMVACAELNQRVIILDRPNPLGGTVVNGNIPEDTLQSFVARIPVAYVHGMTLGELATMSNGEHWLGKDGKGLPLQCSLTVVRCKRWTRDTRFEDTMLQWYPTSPNIPTVHAARGYPVTGLLGELGSVYIGIGSASPFTVVGAPSLTFDTVLVQRLQVLGTHAMQAMVVPASGRFAGTLCHSYHLTFSSDASAQPYLSAMALMIDIYRASRLDTTLIAPAQTLMFKKVSGSSTLLSLIAKGDWSAVVREASRGLDGFKLKRRQYLLYP